MVDFDKEVLELIQERESALYEIEKVLFTKRYKLSHTHLGLFSVQSIAMVYSLWEGFIQRIFQLYINELNSLSLDFKNYSDTIKIFHIEESFKQFKAYPSKPSKKIFFFDSLSDFFSKSTIPLHSAYIDTESNMGFERLNVLMETFCLEKFDAYWRYVPQRNLPNLKERFTNFLRYRNSIAHGGDISSEEKVTQEVYNEYRNLVIELMYAVRERMLEGLNSKSYLKA